MSQENTSGAVKRTKFQKNILQSLEGSYKSFSNKTFYLTFRKNLFSSILYADWSSLLQYRPNNKKNVHVKNDYA